MRKGTSPVRAAFVIVAAAGIYGGACGKTVESVASDGVGTTSGQATTSGSGGMGGGGGCAPAVNMSDASGSEVTVGGSAPSDGGAEMATVCAVIGPCPAACQVFELLADELAAPISGDCFKLVSVVSNGTASPAGACCYDVIVQPVAC
jgi:hypothetical protein